MPETSKKIAKQFGFELKLKELNEKLDDKIKVQKGVHLFTRIEHEQTKPKDKENPNLNKAKAPKEIMEGITTIEYTDFEKIELRVGEIENVENIEGADKLYKLTISLGEETRTICAGIKQYYSHDELKGMKIVVLCNLKPRKLRGIESQGMLLAAANQDQSKVVLIGPTTSDIEVGSRVM
jgi:methionyl-tRNA synthetase